MENVAQLICFQCKWRAWQIQVEAGTLGKNPGPFSAPFTSKFSTFNFSESRQIPFSNCTD